MTARVGAIALILAICVASIVSISAQSVNVTASSTTPAAPPSSRNDDHDDNDDEDDNNNHHHNHHNNNNNWNWHNNDNNNNNNKWNWHNDDDNNKWNWNNADDDWESYAMSVPQGTNAAGYSLIVYDRETCSGVNATLTALRGNFPDNLDDAVESYRICPPGVIL